MKSSERSVSVWEATRVQRDFPPLAGDATADVCVVGAGIAGMTVAYVLAKAGKRVIVLDDNAVGGGETGQTTAHLASAQDDYLHVLEKIHGRDGARIAYESHHAAIDLIEQIVTEERLDADFRRVDGYWFLTPDEDRSLLEKERDAAHRAGAAGVEILERAPGAPFDTGPVLRFPRQGQFHVLKYLEGLTCCLERDGAHIHTGNHVESVEGGDRPRVSGPGFSVTADAVVVCTNSPISDRFAIHTKQAPYRTYVVGARIPSGSMAPMLLWDTGDPAYHYVRTQPAEAGFDWLIVGGEDHKTGHEDDAGERYARLEAWTRERFPVQGFELRWSGQVMEPIDYMGFIGRDPGGHENVYIATGDSGQGMTHGTIAGILIGDLVRGRPNEWEKLYDPGRKTLSVDSAMQFLHENLDVGVKLTELVPGVGTDAKSAEEVAPGTGAIVQRGLAKVAVYRDEGGAVHECVANCTHLGCIVHWNSEEKSWDCPCHGSRFSPDGQTVLNGPAPFPLKKYQEGK